MAWAPDYITEDDLKEYARIGDDVDDVQVALAIASASRAVDAACRRQFGLVAAPELRTYYARPDYTSGYWVVDVDDFQTLTGLVVNVAGDVNTTHTPGPANASQNSRPWTRIHFVEASEFAPSYTTDLISVTARWGWTAVPTPIAQATLLQASRLLLRRNAPFGVAGSPEMGNELRLLAKLDPDVAVLLKGYKRPRRTG
jgi:hypothetical protein